MITPESPLEKRVVETTAEAAAEETRTLTLEERVGRLEITLENAFNALARGIHESELRTVGARNEMQAELARTLTMMNLSALQSIVTLKEVVKQLTEKNVLDQAKLDENVSAALKEAVDSQQAAMQEAVSRAQAEATQAEAQA